MSTTSLPWTNVILATTELYAALGEQEIVLWHSEGTTMFIVMVNREEITLKMDQEIFDVKVCLTLKLLASI
jgi:hypothetical protein